MSRYRWIMFDADGTLYDFDAAETTALVRTLEQAGLPAGDGACRHYREISLELWRAFELGEIALERLKVERFERLLAELGAAVDPLRLSRAYISHLCGQAPLLPGAHALVQELASDHGLVLATNGIAEVQRRRFEPSPIRPYFSHLVISEEIGAAKPQPAYFERAFALMGDPPREEVLMVGDSLTSDIAGGIAFGVDTVWFNPGRLPLDGDPRPTWEIGRLEEVRGILRELRE